MRRLHLGGRLRRLELGAFQRLFASLDGSLRGGRRRLRFPRRRLSLRRRRRARRLGRRESVRVGRLERRPSLRRVRQLSPESVQSSLVRLGGGCRRGAALREGGFQLGDARVSRGGGCVRVGEGFFEHEGGSLCRGGELGVESRLALAERLLVRGANVPEGRLVRLLERARRSLASVGGFGEGGGSRRFRLRRRRRRSLELRLDVSQRVRV